MIIKPTFAPEPLKENKNLTDEEYLKLVGERVKANWKSRILYLIGVSIISVLGLNVTVKLVELDKPIIFAYISGVVCSIAMIEMMASLIIFLLMYLTKLVSKISKRPAKTLSMYSGLDDFFNTDGLFTGVAQFSSKKVQEEYKQRFITNENIKDYLKAKKEVRNASKSRQ